MNSAIEDFDSNHIDCSVDISVLIRQYLNYFSGGVEKLPVDFCKAILSSFNLCNLKYSENASSEYGFVRSLPWNASEPELSGVSFDSKPTYRRLDNEIDGDGFLRLSSNGLHTKYKSISQQAALHTTYNLPKGKTVLIILPTGEGKSIIGIADAIQRANSGIDKCGTNLVVVPTISLAIDQQNNARKYFTKLPENKQPMCYSGNSNIEKQRIRELRRFFLSFH